MRGRGAWKEPTGRGLDWDALRRQYADRRRAEGATEEEIAAEQVDGKQVVYDMKEVARANRKTETATSKPAPKKRGPKPGTRVGGIKKDPIREKQILALHAEGLPVPEIGRRLDLAPQTVRRYITEAGKEPIPGKGGTPPSDRCSRGHRKRPGEYCKECRRERDAEWHRANYRRDKAS